MPCRAVVLLTLALPLAAEAADVYRCIDQGVITYQDFPCRASEPGKAVRLGTPESAPARTGGQADLQALRKSVDTMARERREREINTEVEGLERQIARLATAEAAELAPLKDRRLYVAQNLQGDPYGLAQIEREVTEQMAAISAKYRERTGTVRRRIDELRNEQKGLALPRQ